MFNEELGEMSVEERRRRGYVGADVRPEHKIE